MIADVEGPSMDTAVAEMNNAGIDAVGVLADVSSEQAMDELAEAAFARFGRVNVVCNNAGVAIQGQLQAFTAADWKWVLGVNLWGVIHGIRVFLAHLLDHGDGHIVNTASVAGHTSFPGIGAYSASKHAVVAISETLYSECRESGSTLGVSVLCPGMVSTNITSSERNRPATLRSPVAPPDPTLEQDEQMKAAQALFDNALKPAAVGEQVYRAVLDKQFYIWTDDSYAPAVMQRHEDIRQGRNPSYRGPLIDEGHASGPSEAG